MPRFNDPAEQLMAQSPHWQPYSAGNKNNHRLWRWTAPDGTVHTAGCGSGGHSTNDAMTDAKFLKGRIRRCEGGACDHIPAGVIDEQHLTAEPGAPVIHAGQQVSVNGKLMWVTEIHDGIATVMDEAGADDVVPTTDLKIANILDPIHKGLDERVWEHPEDAEPKLKADHLHWIERQILNVLKTNGYHDADQWLSLVFTGSLTTYQYSDDSDVDISLFVDSEVFPEWSRAELIGLMVGHVDGTKLPGTPFPMQCFVVPPTISREDLYKPGLRSGYDLKQRAWIVPPERSRAYDVKSQQNGDYAYALEQADKMERLLQFEPEKAELFWHQIHSRRQASQRAGKGDYSPANIVYKFLANRGLFPKIADLTGEYIAKKAGLLDGKGNEDINRLFEMIDELGGDKDKFLSELDPWKGELLRRGEKLPPDSPNSEFTRTFGVCPRCQSNKIIAYGYQGEDLKCQMCHYQWTTHVDYEPPDKDFNGLKGPDGNVLHVKENLGDKHEPVRAWEPGFYGKGIIHDDGTPYLWATRGDTEGGSAGFPHHNHVYQALGTSAGYPQGRRNAPAAIDPEGNLRVGDYWGAEGVDPGALEKYKAFHPAVKPEGQDDDWQF